MGAIFSGGMAALQFGGAYSQAEGMKAQGAYQRQQYEANARMAEIHADDAVSRGDKEAGEFGKKVRQVGGAARAAYAAQGLDVGSGSAAEVQSQIKEAGAQDQMTIKNNAWREAWGFKVQASSLRGEGAMAEAAAKSNARNTLLTGGLQAVDTGVKAYDRWNYSKGRG